ncbi:MAG TPA: phosphotransferase [Gammaproteobacteria bacterium]|nr:phosphotransferase [Gammaproteobacteria bacterium]
MRQQEIHAWLSSLLPATDLSNLQYIQADASSRKYLRLRTPTDSFVIMDTKPDQELTKFITIAKILAAHKISVPQIIHCNAEQGLLLMSDLGTQTYQEILANGTTEQIDSLYLDAIMTLLKIQRINTNASVGYEFISMNDAYIRTRLEIFSTWYLQKHLGLALDDNILHIIDQMQQLFSKTFAEVPQVLVHVDYHCRNLMVTPTNNPGVLDFQDAACGPITYDLVSLFQDAYISWPRSQVESWVNTYQEFATQAGIMPPMSSTALLRNFDLVGLQRHIKNLGIFARLHHRDQKSNYLHDIPALLRYIGDTCQRYSELSWLMDFIAEEVQG